MKTITVTALSAIIAALLALSSYSSAIAFDRQVVRAMSVCHGYIERQERFRLVPFAAVSVHPYSVRGDVIVISWHVNSNNPPIKAAGNCVVVRGEVDKFEDFTA